MSLRKCVTRAMKAGEIDNDRAAAALARLDELEEGFAAELGPGVTARLEAEKVLTAEQKALAAHRARQKLKQFEAQRDRWEEIVNFRDDKGQANPEWAAMRKIDSHGLTYSGKSAEGERRAVLSRAISKMQGLLREFRKDVLGRERNKALLMDVVREAHGQNTGNVYAKELAAAWQQTAEWLRLQFNAAGGHIGKLKDWGLPHRHDMARVRSAEFEGWRDFILPRLDLARMIDGRTGNALSGEELNRVLEEVYNTIATDGWSKRKPGAAGQKALGNRRVDHRFLHFADADAWMEYHEHFGRGDAFEAMMSHLDGMSRDIGAMRTLGPNPAATVRWLGDKLQEAASRKGADALKKSASSAKELTTLFGHYTGSVNRAENSVRAEIFQASRNVLVSAQLGSATLSAVSDPAFAMVTAKLNGIPAATYLRELVGGFNPADPADRKLAAALGIEAEDMAHAAAAGMRFAGEMNGPELSRRLADGVIRVSGLNAWTITQQRVWRRAVLRTMADNAAVRFSSLDANYRAMFERYGINEAEWDVIRKTGLFEHPRAAGVHYLSPEDIASRTDIDAALADDLATKVMIMVQTEGDAATPAYSLTGRAKILGETSPGSASGMLTRGFMTYKGFAVAVWYNHILRMAEMQGGWNKATYAANLIISTTLLGALAVQLKDISKGRDPRPMDNLAFWGAAQAQGGGFGILGDFFYTGLSGANRFGHGIESTIAGPVVGAVQDIGNLLGGAARDVSKGEYGKAGRKTLDFIDRYTPGVWYLETVKSRLLFDQGRLLADPQAGRRMERFERKLRKQNDQGLWWRQGEFAPDRAPDLGNAFEGN